MVLNRFYLLCAWLCIIWFGLSNSLLAAGMVICRDGHGQTRIELGCDWNAGGECVTSCGTSGLGEADDHAGPSHPCDDVPIKGDHQVTSASPRTAGNVAVLVPLIVAAMVMPFDLPPAASRVMGDHNRSQQRPPEDLLRLRSVILLV